MRLSDFVDSFLKYAAQKVPSYVRDTTDFINKISSYTFQHVGTKPIYLVTMDVVSLYPNIDQHGRIRWLFSLNAEKATTPQGSIQHNQTFDLADTEMQCYEFPGTFLPTN